MRENYAIIFHPNRMIFLSYYYMILWISKYLKLIDSYLKPKIKQKYNLMNANRFIGILQNRIYANYYYSFEFRSSYWVTTEFLLSDFWKSLQHPNSYRTPTKLFYQKSNLKNWKVLLYFHKITLKPECDLNFLWKIMHYSTPIYWKNFFIRKIDEIWWSLMKKIAPISNWKTR